ncbi:hypothetical protein ILUMI_12462 [Ignelater luminosus]|uniref:Zinc finger PHD-type domain-containing protein n=1 Tax=Ignelater luminosus TaxID=2038154 RepID=A0A8K0CYE9_IGNLU|nr:hypothetical protein ILUMI_12462 [Ignelater luminosus]
MEDSKSAKVPAKPNSFLQKQENNPAEEVPYCQAVGMLMFLAIVSRPDIIFSVAQLAGKDWYYNFMKRHPSISLRTPEATSLNRITAFNEVDVKTFYDNLKTIQDKHHIQPDKIFNVDETGITTVQKNLKIVAAKGEKQVSKATSAERGQTDTRPPNVRENDIHTNQMVIYDQQAPDAHNHSSDISTVAEVHSAKTFDIQAFDTQEREKKEEKENVDYYCIFCKDKYVSPPNEDWIMCYVCEDWAHEKCTDREPTSAGYKCDLCRN